MRRSYNREVDLCVPIDSIENYRFIHSLIPRFDEFDLYEEEYEDCDV